ncbi:hypothetical protein ACLOJK_003107 [Asimina triloba]
MTSEEGEIKTHVCFVALLLGFIVKTTTTVDYEILCFPAETRGAQENPEAELQKNSNATDGSPSPRCVLEIPVLGGESDQTSSSVGSVSSRSSSNESLASETNGLQWKNFMSLLRKKSMRRLSTFPLTASELSRRNLSRKLARLRNGEDGVEDVEEVVVPKPSWRIFDYEELVAATDNFSSGHSSRWNSVVSHERQATRVSVSESALLPSSNQLVPLIRWWPDKLIGKGGHAEVYKGCLPDGQLLAVKRLTKRKTEEDIITDFLSELGIIAHIDHPNVARLLGFGVDGGLHLVLQFSPHGSLASLLHGSNGSLDWSVRFKAAVGVAEGLKYLHHGCRRRIIHRDIKASNILLTDDFEPQVHTTDANARYLAPEYFMHGIVDEKTDVFAFGVLLLELITGRRAVDASRQSLVMWVRFGDDIKAKPLLDANNMKELVDPCLGDAYDPGEMRCATSAASMCIHHLSAMRPHMNQVLQILRGETARVREHRPNLLKALLLDAYELEDYTCSRYLSDLNRHRKLALE